MAGAVPPSSSRQWRLGFWIFFLREIQGDGVDAIPQSRRLRTVIKDVTEVRIALFAKHFHACHSIAPVRLYADVLFGNRLPETRPSSSGFEFRLGAEQRVPATNAPVDSFLVQLVVFTGERRLRPLSSSDLKLLGCEQLLPFFLCFYHFLRHDDPFLLSGIRELRNGNSNGPLSVFGKGSGLLFLATLRQPSEAARHSEKKSPLGDHPAVLCFAVPEYRHLMAPPEMCSFRQGMDLSKVYTMLGCVFLACQPRVP